MGVGTLLPIRSLPEGSSAIVEMIVANDVDSFTIKNSGISVGTSLLVSGGTFTSDGLEIMLSGSISRRILARITSMGD